MEWLTSLATTSSYRMESNITPFKEAFGPQFGRAANSPQSMY